MKMAISIESAGVHSALRDSIANSSSQAESNENITDKIIAIAKKILLTNIEYEEVNNYDQSVLDSFKTKYTVLKPYNSGKLLASQGDNVGNNIFEKSGNQLCNTLNYQHQMNQKNSNGLPQAKRILFPRESVRVGWRSSGRKWQIGSGMMNVGNTCYLNSTLQALFHVPAMANWLISDSEHREECRGENNIQDGCIICAMAKTLICSQVSSSAIRPQLVYSRLKQICKHLIFGRQEDAHEFLRYLVEAMEKSYLLRFKNYKELDQYSKETTPLNQILGGYLKTSVRCLSCGHVSTTFQHFQDLLLDIRKPNTIEEALDGYFAKERLEDMGYKCESCKKKVSAIKQFTLERAPISLCIQLKRFSMVGTKINKYIAIRPRLDLTKYATNKNGNESLSYKLVAMVTHLGASQHCGHYTAIGLTDQGGYYQFDDSCVRPISLPNVLNTNAYIIFYELDENQQSKPVCTQVSGENEIFKNDLSKNNENSIQQKSTDNVTLNNENISKNVNGLHSPKVISKLDFVSENDKEINNGLSNSNNFIGPQLPLEMSCEGSANNIVLKKDAQTCNDIKSTTVQKFKQSENIVASSSKLSTNASKLLIHFKGSSSNTNGNHNGVETEKNGSEITSKNQSNLIKSPNSGFKIQQSVEENCNNSSDFTCKKEEKQCVENSKSSLLPSMPKLDSNFESSGAGTITNILSQTSKTSIKPSSWAGPLSSNYMTKQNHQNDGNNKNFLVSNGVKKSPIKSLVPYGSDGDEDSTDSSDNEISKKPKLDKDTQSRVEENISESLFNKLNGETRKCGFSTSNETSPETSPEAQRIKSNSPSPHIVKTKAGLWQVTPITPSGSPKARPESNEENLVTKTPSNPFNPNSTPIPASMFYSDRNFSGGNNIYAKKEEKCPTIKELTKYSHRGYGANVLSWNGTKSEMEMVVNEEARQERKRQIQNDEENEIDRGRQKKVKNICSRQNDSNPGYNPFQEQQLQKNSEHIRHNWITGNNTNRNLSKSNTTIRYHYQNNFNNNHGFDMSSNSNDNSNCNINFSNKITNAKNNYNNNISKDGGNNNHDNDKYSNDSNNNSNIHNSDSNCNNDNDNTNNIYNKFSNKFNKSNTYNTNSFNNKSSHSNKNNNTKNNSNNCFFRNDINNPNYNNHNSNNNSNNNNNNQYNKANNIGNSKIYNQHSFLNRIHNSSSNCFRRHNSKRFNLNQRLINHQKSGEWR